MEAICRACLQSSSKVLKFDDFLTKIHKIFQCFESLTSLELKPNEIDSKICLDCFGELKRGFEFRQQCRENDQRYQELIGVDANLGVPSGLEMVIIKQEESDGTFMEESQIFEIKDVKPETTDYSIADSESSEILQHPAPKSHKSQYRGKRLEGFSKCNYCEQFYQGKRAVYLRKKHEKEVHPKDFFQDCDEQILDQIEIKQEIVLDPDEFPQPTTSKNKSQRSFECDVCGKVCSGKTNIRSHVPIHAKFAIYECSLCEKLFKLRTNLRGHINGVHLTADKRLECKICGRKLKKQKLLRTQLETHNDSKIFECLDCGKNFKRKKSLKTHSVVHSDRKDFKCTICEKSFKRKEELEAHLRRHEDKKEFECKVCGKSFKTNSNRSIHQRQVHQTARNFKCPQCEKSFKTKADIKRHIIVHSQIKPFECPECGKSFKRKIDLQQHLITHSDKRDFKCEICNKEFKRPDHLKTHKLTHSNKKIQEISL